MRAVLKQWGVAFGLGVLLVAALFLGICATFADAAQAQTPSLFPARHTSTATR